jgi:hypothetical protein
MKSLYPWIGWLYIAIAIGGLLVWLSAEPSRWFSAVVSSNVSLLVAGALLGLLVFGILMVIGESDTRGR